MCEIERERERGAHLPGEHAAGPSVVSSGVRLVLSLSLSRTHTHSLSLAHTHTHTLSLTHSHLPVERGSDAAGPRVVSSELSAHDTSCGLARAQCTIDVCALRDKG